MVGNFYYPDLNNLITTRFIAFPNTTNKRRNNMEDNEFLLKKEEMLKEIAETLDDAVTLIVRLTKLKNNVKNITVDTDYEKVFRDSFDLEDGLKHIRLF